MTAPTCARCPAPATHVCDCGAAGCDEHRGCEHDPARLRLTDAGLRAQLAATQRYNAGEYTVASGDAHAAATTALALLDRAIEAEAKATYARSALATANAESERLRAEIARRDAAIRAYLAARQEHAAALAEGGGMLASPALADAAGRLEAAEAALRREAAR